MGQSGGKLRLVYNADSTLCGYADKSGKAVVPVTNYQCFDGLIRKVVIVAEPDGKLRCYNATGSYLYDMLNIDNGPDEFNDGLIRIVKNDLIGFADAKGKVCIEPKYACAWPFGDGVAQVSLNCTKTIEYEMEKWESEEWFWIDRSGNVVEKSVE
jgi:hypothetical protein